MSNADTRTQEWYKVIIGRPEQKEAITSDASLTVVSAGAGTGKTHTLAQRFAWLLASDTECGVDEILVLTFTEKAAREMRERIQSTVVKWREAYPQELKHLEKSIKYMDDAYISTIHSFAMKIIRESALALDVDPTASIIPAPKEELWWERFSKALGFLSPKTILPLPDGEWEARAQGLFSEAVFSDFISEYGPDVLAKAAKTASEVLGSAGKTPDALWNQSDDNIMGDVGSMRDYPRSVRELWMTRVLPEITAEMRETPGRLTRLIEILDEYSGLEANGENCPGFCRLLFDEGISNLQGGKVILKNAINTALGEPLKEWRDRELRNFLKTEAPSGEEKLAASLLNRTCALGWYCWDALRSQDGVLSMNDLIRYAGEVLEKTPSYSAKFKHILVDEFQDTDRLQDKLLASLWREGSNTLFIVGDLKQSIYRFRHADLRIFQDYIMKARDGGEHKYKYITLDRSYRTKGELLGSFNDIFSNLWSGGLEKGTSMTYEPLGAPEDEAWWEERNAPELQPVFEAYLSAAGNMPEEALEQGQKDNVDTARLTLFKELGRRMADIHLKKSRIWDKSGPAPGFREVRWSDFAVLVPARNVYSLLEKAFGEIGVPYVLCTNKNYFSRGEVADASGLVSLLADPQNPLYLAGWISSPLSGASHGDAESCIREAWRLKKRGEKLPLAEVVKIKLPEVWGEIERLRKLAQLRGVSSAILDLLRKPYFLSFYEPQQRRGVIANLTRFSQLADEYESSEGISLAGFADYLSMITLAEAEKETPDITDEDEDAVRVLTIHSSKGLEYPVIAVLCGNGGWSASGPVFVSARYGAAPVRIPAFLGGDSEDKYTVTYLWYSDSEKEKEAAERERLFYVALTRARDKLFLCATGNYDKKTGEIKQESFGTFMNTVLGTKYNGASVAPKHVAYSGRGGFQPRNMEQPSQKTTAMNLPDISPAKLARLSASAYAMLAWCPRAYRIAYRQGRNLQWVVKSDEEQGGADFGSLAHWILSRWDFDAATLENWLPQYGTAAYEKIRLSIPPYIREIFGKAAVRDELAGMLSRYAASEEGKKMSVLAAEGRLSRETPFLAHDGQLTLVGSIDIMWEDEKGLHIVDWKTTAEETAPGEYYDGQLSFYAYAAWICKKKAILPGRNISAVLNYLRADSPKAEAISFDEEKLSETGVRIHAAAELALSGSFAGEPGKCVKCPWRGDCGGVRESV